MPDSRFEGKKDAIIGTITEAFARGDMEMPAFEAAVTKINASPDETALAATAAELGIALPAPLAQPDPAAAPVAFSSASSPSPASADAPIDLACRSSNLRKIGDWLRSRHYRLALQSSNARLDLGEYEGVRGLRLLVEVEAASSNLKLIVPAGFRVEDRFAENSSSNVRNRPKDAPYGDNVVVLMGSLRSSNVRVRYKR
jgi:hypothetical protein